MKWIEDYIKLKYQGEKRMVKRVLAEMDRW